MLPLKGKETKLAHGSDLHLYRKHLKNYQAKKSFVGIWGSGDSDSPQDFSEIDQKKCVTVGMEGNVTAFSEDYFENTYSGAKIKGTKLSFHLKNIDHYLLSPTIF